MAAALTEAIKHLLASFSLHITVDDGVGDDATVWQYDNEAAWPSQNYCAKMIGAGFYVFHYYFYALLNCFRFDLRWMYL